MAGSTPQSTTAAPIDTLVTGYSAHESPSPRDEIRPEAFGIGKLFWSIQEAVVVADAASGRILLWNPAAEAIFGYSAAEATGLSVDALVPPHLQDRHRTGLAHYAATGEGRIIGSSRSLELPALRKDGSQLFIELSLSPIIPAASNRRCALAVIRDVTARRLAEDEQRRREREAASRREAEAAMERFAMLARAGELLMDTFEAEASLARVAGLLVPQFADACRIDVVAGDGQVQRAADVQAFSSPETRADQLPTDPAGPYGVAEVLRTGEPLLLCDVDRESATAEPGGRSVMVVPMAARGMTLGAVTLVREADKPSFTPADLAFAGQLGRTVALAIDNARLYREAREALQVREEFLASASHELRTPVTTIKAYAQMLQRRVARLQPEDAEHLLEGLENIDDSASRLAVHINQLLDLSRLQTGRSLELDRSPTDLVALARQAAAAWRRLSGRHRIRVRGAAPELVGQWDGARLERVIGNLLSNAVKFSPEGGEVQLTLASEGMPPHTAVLRVHDTGIGIPPRDLPRIFQRFYRGSNLSDRMSGSGIGLASVDEIVRRHGGSVQVESELGKGTVVTMRLPLAPAADADGYEAPDGSLEGESGQRQ